MQDSEEKTEPSCNENNEVFDKRQYFISDKKFLLVKQCRQAIYEATETLPAVRKIINELITEENLQKIKTKFIEVWKY